MTWQRDKSQQADAKELPVARMRWVFAAQGGHRQKGSRSRASLVSLQTEGWFLPAPPLLLLPFQVQTFSSASLLCCSALPCAGWSPHVQGRPSWVTGLLCSHHFAPLLSYYSRRDLWGGAKRELGLQRVQRKD